MADPSVSLEDRLWRPGEKSIKKREAFGLFFAHALGVGLGLPSPFFPGILLSSKPPKTLGKWLVFEKNSG